ncbi:GH92 family glycosyl hydrolase [Burkholderia cenocepacia]|uniref:GH92 family glycosyl hydrolase n=1 Tax=Burkholderia cenocepacia TaxID=95486 RepID=UPI001B9B80EA|nr:GH92 family glycosyl hydrolase [Burkholderia cenocepacia]MBR8116398.1 GH92 family glycosyl hydrolase [Burkholderia cenocepacia]MBR8368102.1 GH92 family glycosyl hydrolase [Burkholderia cenocepacia]MBR8436554.1 GH92 family glycosyl hydrolase [Burkholderia cenocepacia]
MKLRHVVGIGCLAVLSGCGGDQGATDASVLAQMSNAPGNQNDQGDQNDQGVNGAHKRSVLRSVDPMIGTANLDINADWSSGVRGHGHVYPGATVPFGMVQLGPDTTGGAHTLPWNWDRTSGYQYDDPFITGFTHTHLSGTGIGSGGEVRFQPTLAPVDTATLAKVAADASITYDASFSHDDETASPGYYRVKLAPVGSGNTPWNVQGAKILAEMTATTHAGVHRYTYFPSAATQKRSMIVSIDNPIGGSTASGKIQVVDARTIAGWQFTNNWANNKPTYFVARFSKPFDTQHVAFSADGFKAYLTFADGGDGGAVTVKVGISPSSIADAQANLASEVGAKSFDQVRGAAERVWSAALDRVRIKGGSADQRTMFYTSLYRTMLAPTVYNNADGSYVGMDSSNDGTTSPPTTSKHANPGFDYSSTFSLWDTFRAEAPLMTLVQPERVDGWVKSLLTQFAQNGKGELPVWPLAQTETFTMAGHPSIPMIADAYLKHLTSAGIDDIWTALTTTQRASAHGFDQYRQRGYVYAGDNASVSTTQDYAFDDWATAAVGKAAGKSTADYQPYLTRSQNYRNVFNPAPNNGWKFSQPKGAQGNWVAGFDPTAAEKTDFSESNSWVDTWNIFHDFPGLITLLGGTSQFIAQLDRTFDPANPLTFQYNQGFPDLTGRSGQFFAGNEPANHLPYLYDVAGMPSKTQDRVRTVMDDMYSLTLTAGDRALLSGDSLKAALNDPRRVRDAAIPGNDDCGQLSAWYVLSALGIYSLNPVGGVFYFGTPLFEEASVDIPMASGSGAGGALKFGGARRFTITAHTASGAGPSSVNRYVQSVSLNGAPLHRPYITYDEIKAGGRLDFVMGSTPNDAWVGQWNGQDPNSALAPSLLAAGGTTRAQ